MPVEINFMLYGLSFLEKILYFLFQLFGSYLKLAMCFQSCLKTLNNNCMHFDS